MKFWERCWMGASPRKRPRRQAAPTDKTDRTPVQGLSKYRIQPTTAGASAVLNRSFIEYTRIPNSPFSLTNSWAFQALLLLTAKPTFVRDQVSVTFHVPSPQYYPSPRRLAERSARPRDSTGIKGSPVSPGASSSEGPSPLIPQKPCPGEGNAFTRCLGSLSAPRAL